ncbi:alpha/beta-hydrolase [Corynespora cassiicola Philippines]|uniref:Alpha/beta-hydrolase n=1 Tax=Corynespora cassiicola Philippines TaxID=1448308 RepID=A0A2T2NIV7_CORCC|nr:alpha/beta-hydrolase [Corynespora cassiicola Philippines]
MAEEYRRYAQPHPEWIDFPKNLPPGTRHTWLKRDRKPIEPDPKLDIDEFTINARDDYNILLRYYRRKQISDVPLFIYMHGGGFVSGSLDSDDRTCRAIAKAIDICVLSVEYRLAPEHQFPIGYEDCWDTLRWSTSKGAADLLKVQPEKGLLLGGTSAGANFAASLAHEYRDQGLNPPINGLVFWAGSWCHPDVRPPHLKPFILSVDEIDDSPSLRKSSIEHYRKKYGAPKDDTRYSPLLFEDWSNVANKAYFAICGWDPRRDEGICFAQILRQAGLEVRDHIYSGLPHGFWTTCPDLPVSEIWRQDVISGIKWLLQDERK